MPEARSADRRLRILEDLVEVCLESAEENMASAMALRASALLDSKWNGWARPIATAAAMRDFLNRWRRNDPNGTWGDAIEADGQLVCTNSDTDDPDLFPQVGTTRRGEPLYDLTGWMWVALESSPLGSSSESGSPQA